MGQRMGIAAPRKRHKNFQTSPTPEDSAEADTQLSLPGGRIETNHRGTAAHNTDGIPPPNPRRCCGTRVPPPFGESDVRRQLPHLLPPILPPLLPPRNVLRFTTKLATLSHATPAPRMGIAGHPVTEPNKPRPRRHLVHSLSRSTRSPLGGEHAHLPLAHRP